MLSRNMIQDVLVDQWAVLQEQRGIQRAFHWEENLNYCLVGIRRAGKSYLMMQRIRELLQNGVSEDAILYVNFEDERLLEITSADLNRLLEVQAEAAPQHKVEYVFLDEIQIVTGWEKFVRRLADSNYHVYVTGSNAKMLSREIATTLGGRFIIQEVFPYSFPEYLTASGLPMNKKALTTQEKATVYQQFTAYLMEGAFPELIGLTSKTLYLSNIYQTIYLGDIIARNNIANEFSVRLILKKIAESVGRPLSYTRLTGIVKGAGMAMGKSTVIKYVSYMQDSYLLFSIRNYTGKLLEKETNPKYYFMDTGLLNLLLVDGTTKALENLVAIELLRRYGEQEVYCYEENIEVDFYVPKIHTAIQVCYDLHQAEETLEREVKALLKLQEFLGKQELLILTASEEEELVRDGVTIHVLPMWKWLLG